jgi:outer membrane protein OmpA-like peptidoglycan-associated protein
VEGNDSRESYDLSMQRANAVRNYMIEQGIDDSRVRISAYGNIRYRSSGVSGGVEVRFF